MIGTALVVVAAHYADIPAALVCIVTQAFIPEGAKGGFIAVLILGFRRAAFSNEAGTDRQRRLGRVLAWSGEAKQSR